MINAQMISQDCKRARDTPTLKPNSHASGGHVNSVKRIEPDETLKKDLERVWTTESFGIKPDVQLPVSPEEIRAWEILKSSTKHNGKR